MPRYSERAVRIAALDRWMVDYLDHKTRSRVSHHALGMQMSRIDLDTDVPISMTFAGCVMQQLRGLRTNRYLSRPRRRPEALSFAPSWIHDDSLLTKREFGVLFRMTKESFDELLSLIDDHPVFSNNSSCPQKPPKYQLQVTLYHYGGGATGSRMRTAIQFAIAEGTVHLYVHRVTEAILALQREYIRWPEPNSSEYAEIVE
jgi:hypothetical protein